ncbi:hypothetical protein P153DRAFT_111916 [Dothidotthia symphoricarpi CBS 119687]|uniref:NPCC-domain-containing protein n=1 Tax=Dothidotthia symphoricarpi CBS 119687 TaxID=1392245 RepID=A0A6A6A0M5_9PLEO|nr:uncharacterized protein P153DRAFT_111916 [Dothidotthia symphoricarpi CBS 119687]KAF2125370.1 hypothetical protein P153DRAFT_111916 [Dothidotthia symphoricarpi CBS 119687]
MSVARLAPPATPQTPATPTAQRHQLDTPNGAWKHPKFDEIARRQYATTFDERNVRTIVANTGLLILSVYGNAISSKVKLLEYAATPMNTLIHRTPYSEWVVVFIQLAFAANIVLAFMPLVRRYYPDDMADIPLTPSQRAAMGLKGGVLSPPTAGAAYASPNYVTPPRYQRSTPRGSFSNQGSQSPLLGASLAKSMSNSPSNMGSPLYRDGLGGSTTKRANYGGSPMGSSLFGDSGSSGPGTPTPSTGRASVGLNNKWLYEKRRDSPRSNMFT